ncbi:DUF4178 domain-containing protein [Synechococcus sp. ATX 2A4]|uniref:DUF4178 domain-containing protein n=1 Tax=Synechococcus sp. ATX 2A4 TaxID=2823727 RepID=UPI0020CE6E92|nr:DUF4178 domain-containing protein [Synechococcus sp. ATX 2A4]MCP9883688.1 DUF4178 domain-containing protein [Synechococcus sp. ATX 2A4]
MTVWVLLLALLVAAFVVLQLRRWRRRPAALPQDRTLFTLCTGDIVQFEGRDWVVEDRLLYNEEGFEWLEYLLRDGTDGRWLSVTEDDWLEVSWLEGVNASELALAPLVGPGAAHFPAHVQFDGVRYALKEQGQASISSSARVMNRRQSGCRYADYTAAGGLVLSLEQWDLAAAAAAGQAPDPPELSVGRLIDPALLTLLPGDGRSVYR